jgi:broad specificity phosphatase PhoE
MAGEQTGGDGTRASGFVHNSENRMPRQCGNCIFYDENEKCSNRAVIEDPEVPKNGDGTAKVDADDCCNFFMSRGNTVVYILRHGETANNKNNLFRGWIDVPLNDKGKKEAQRAREFLADKKIKRVFCSDLGRTEATAKLAIPSIKAERDPQLRPWDVGVFSGKPRDENQEALNHYIDNPEKPIPDGESLKEFSKRTGKVLARYIKEGQEDGPILLVTSSSNAIQAEKFIEGKDELGRPEDVDRVLPGGVMAILDEEKAGMKVEVVFGDAPETNADYGS